MQNKSLSLQVSPSVEGPVPSSCLADSSKQVCVRKFSLGLETFLCQAKLTVEWWSYHPIHEVVLTFYSYYSPISRISLLTVQGINPIGLSLYILCNLAKQTEHANMRIWSKRKWSCALQRCPKAKIRVRKWHLCPLSSKLSIFLER